VTKKDDRVKVTLDVSRLSIEFKGGGGFKIAIGNSLGLAMGVYSVSSSIVERIFGVQLSAPATMIVAIAMAFIAGGLYYLMGAWLSEREKKEQAPSLILSDWYAHDIQSASLSAYVILFACLGISLIRQEYGTASVVGFVALGIFIFGFLTKYRAARGWFADNGYEALELLNFIISKHEKDGLPPGARVARSPSEVLEAERATAERIAGARA
jgi:hypothetical protein